MFSEMHYNKIQNFVIKIFEMTFEAYYLYISHILTNIKY